jgi:hypothetical protein
MFIINKGSKIKPSRIITFNYHNTELKLPKKEGECCIVFEFDIKKDKNVVKFVYHLFFIDSQKRDFVFDFISNSVDNLQNDKLKLILGN